MRRFRILLSKYVALPGKSCSANCIKNIMRLTLANAVRLQPSFAAQNIGSWCSTECKENTQFHHDKSLSYERLVCYYKLFCH